MGAPLHAADRAPRVEDRNFGVSIELGPGLTESKVDPLDRLLVADGFATQPSTRVIGVLDAVVMLGRMRFVAQVQGGRSSSRHVTAGTELATSITRGALLVGLEPLRFDEATFWIATGIGGGSLVLDGRTEGFTYFEPQLKSWERGHVSFEHVFVPVELGYDYLAPLGVFEPSEVYALLFGVRAGYAFQTGGSWSTTVEGESRDLVGPALDLSAVHFRLVVGLSLF